ncbi:uncharacterized protein BT62DRAFT_506386 [Guyanagaster necrorhizus]|uniref:Uncharacterized protein n=1 Tax=Guyanagaster necrorhizus TaxID=856835 RepID=A0A9P7W2W9_9AGAR|nr:uncharacterized protein BT62DRAFT_506386 [Guyanagaster necrorhizus MCA 3950]KAG7450341.1 hypothetical protein BT62DRAFT_506386 [Guyanagaster necrorhizus MCA 3950]
MSNSSSPPDSSFMPRREFIREQRHTPNTFSLLAIASSNCIRLYSFPLPVISHLHRFFDQRSLVSAFREDVSHGLYEFALEGKPWTNAKSAATERLLMEILSIIYQHGYSFLSSIDYGRETDDRLAMAFSKPSANPSFRSDSPLPEGSKISHSDKFKLKVPFALSFPSTTILRVICPPLDTTPAILQAVRGSWPRGVVSERKIGDHSFEFKLKGYRWFQEDTFASDSLQHILSLLSSLDAHSFTLLTSLSLTNRSRVKDLWIFTGLSPPSDDMISDSPVPSILNSSQSEVKRAFQSPESLPHHASSLHHRKLATDPSAIPLSPSPLHPRAVTEGPYRLHGGLPLNHLPSTSVGSAPSHTLRKPAPRAQVPVSVHDDAEGEGYRANLPSTVPSSVENMTGAGALKAPAVFYSTPPFQAEMNPQPSPPASGYPTSPTISDPVLRSSTPPLVSARAQTGDLSARMEAQADAVVKSNSSSAAGTSPLLSPGVFRDSAFSSNTDISAEVPIKWTGIADAKAAETEARPSASPKFPGGWQTTPIEEKDEVASTTSQVTPENGVPQEQPIQDVPHRIASPVLSEPDEELRKSEAGMVGCISPPVTAKGKEKDNKSGKQGWVLVSVEGGSASSPIAAAQADRQLDETGSQGLRHPAQQGSNDADMTLPTSGKATSAAAKAIVIIDAVETKHKHKTTFGKGDMVSESPSRIKRFFSLSRKDSVRVFAPSSYSVG